MEYFLSTHPTQDPFVHTNPKLQAAVQPLHELAVGLLTALPVHEPELSEQLHTTDDELELDEFVVVDDDDTVFFNPTPNPTARPIIRQIERIPNTVVRIFQINALLLHLLASLKLFSRFCSRVKYENKTAIIPGKKPPINILIIDQNK